MFVTIAKVYVMWLHLIINTILPLIALIILNTAIYRKLIKVFTHFGPSGVRALPLAAGINVLV